MNHCQLLFHFSPVSDLKIQHAKIKPAEQELITEVFILFHKTLGQINI